MELSPFASRTITRHLLRGVLGAGLVALSLSNAAIHPLLAVAAGVSAVGVLRGCPMCWTLGLCETVAHRVRRR